MSPAQRRVPFAVVAAMAAIGCLVLLWSVAAPAYRVVDEPQWLSTVLRLADGGGYPTPATAHVEHAVAASYPWAGYPGSDPRTFVPQVRVDAQPPGWPSLAQLAHAPADPQQLSRPDQMTQHPPVWALLAAGEVRALDLEHIPADAAITLLRLLQGLLLVPLPWLVWRTARIAGAGERAAIAAGWLPLLLPQLLHVSTAIGDTALLVLETSLAFPLLAAAAAGDRRWRTALALGGLFGVGLLTKAFALVLLPSVPAAYLLATRRDRRVAALRGGAALALAGALGGWWYVLEKVHTGSFQPNGYPKAVYALFAMHMSVWRGVHRFFSLLMRSAWGDLGWFETPGPMWLVVGLSVGAAALVVAALRVGPYRRRMVALLTPATLLLVTVAYFGVSSYRQLAAIYGVQGRYLFPGLVGIAAALALAGGRVPRRVLVTIPVLGLAAQGLLLAVAAGHFWQGGLATLLTRSVLPGWLLALAGAGLVGCVAAGASLLAPGPGGLAGWLPGARRPRPAPVPPPRSGEQVIADH